MNSLLLEQLSQDMCGNILNVSVDENKVDFTALKTIEADCPDFIVPFTRKIKDGKMEFNYNLHGLPKLQALSGRKTRDDYLIMWSSLVNPLTGFADWFMKPSSFIFDIDYLYFDKRTNKIKYIYVPYTEYYQQNVNENLKSMLSDAEALNQTDSHDVINPILRYLGGKNFSITELKKIIDRLKHSETEEHNPEQQSALCFEKQPENIHNIYNIDNIYNVDYADYENTINPIPDESHKNKSGGFISRLFGKNKLNKPKNEDTEIMDGAVLNYTPEIFNNHDYYDDVTNIKNDKENTNPQLILTGLANVPKIIDIKFSSNNSFTIGRFDSTKNIQQSDFEFAYDIKGISRRQAVIEKKADGYYLTHTGNADTFINGVKIIVGTSVNIKSGDKISFGTIGADYIFN